MKVYAIKEKGSRGALRYWYCGVFNEGFTAICDATFFRTRRDAKEEQQFIKNDTEIVKVEIKEVKE